ncbi:hypothetical protein HZS_7444 [Henneguya salminicola]|nr:hypothetical protein HZS_7444 [Henneguya salminicola]
MHVKFVSPDIKQTRSLDAGFVSKPKDEQQYCKVKIDSQTFNEDNLDIVSAIFKKQPPDNLRKSNFFHFDLSFYDSVKNEALVEKANFIGFQEDNPNEKPLRNGIKYRLNFNLANGRKKTEEILVRLIDSSSKKPISYDGQDKNPDMCRVLLTHEVMCSRCCESKSCGNRNETPSDPVLMSNGYNLSTNFKRITTRYHMKCNQNCLKNAGNPRETRRFQVMIGFIRNNEILQLVTSENMFVHNNSKHGRRPTSVCDSNMSNSCSDISAKLPLIHQVIPKEGKLSGCDEVAIVGENFFEGIQVAFGNQIAYKTEIITNNIMKVITPPCNGSLTVDIKCVHGCRVLLRGISAQFRYNTELYDNQIDFYVERLWTLLPKQPTDIEKPAREIVLRRTIELFEYIYLNNSLFSNSSYENGHTVVNNIQTSVQAQNSNQVTSQNGKEQKNLNLSKGSTQSDGGADQISNNTDYIRQAMLSNNNGNYETVNNTHGYIMQQVLVGMNQMCDSLPVNNQQNFYLPYPGVCETNPVTMNVNFPIKRPYAGMQ